MAAARKSLVSNTGKRGSKGFYSVSLWRLVWQVHSIALLFSQRMIFRGLHRRGEFLNCRRTKNWGFGCRGDSLKGLIKTASQEFKKGRSTFIQILCTLDFYFFLSEQHLVPHKRGISVHAQRCWWDWWCKFLLSWGYLVLVTIIGLCHVIIGSCILHNMAHTPHLIYYAKLA